MLSMIYFTKLDMRMAGTQSCFIKSKFKILIGLCSSIKKRKWIQEEDLLDRENMIRELQYAFVAK